jgi:hypothetical protein
MMPIVMATDEYRFPSSYNHLWVLTRLLRLKEKHMVKCSKTIRGIAFMRMSVFCKLADKFRAKTD